MSERSLAIPVVRLEADGYSVPRGSHGFIDEGAIRWLPPQTGMSSPIVQADLVEAGELLIPIRIFAAAIT